MKTVESAVCPPWRPRRCWRTRSRVDDRAKIRLGNAFERVSDVAAEAAAQRAASRVKAPMAGCYFGDSLDCSPSCFACPCCGCSPLDDCSLWLGQALEQRDQLRRLGGRLGNGIGGSLDLLSGEAIGQAREGAQPDVLRTGDQGQRHEAATAVARWIRTDADLPESPGSRYVL